MEDWYRKKWRAPLDLQHLWGQIDRHSLSRCQCHICHNLRTREIINANNEGDQRLSVVQ